MSDRKVDQQPTVATSNPNSSARDSSASEQAWYSFANTEPAPTHKDCFHAGWVAGKGYARQLMAESAHETAAKAASIDDLIALGDQFILPVDVTIGAGTFKKGIPVGTMLRCVKNHAQYAVADAYSSEKAGEKP